MLERETGLSRERCSALCKRHGWDHYLARTTFSLNERAKSLRKAMARQFMKLIYEDPDYVKKIYFSDETYITYSRTND